MVGQLVPSKRCNLTPSTLLPVCGPGCVALTAQGAAAAPLSCREVTQVETVSSLLPCHWAGAVGMAAAWGAWNETALQSQALSKLERDEQCRQTLAVQ